MEILKICGFYMFLFDVEVSHDFGVYFVSKTSGHEQSKLSWPEPFEALSGKEAEAHSDVDAFMEHCAKRWQTREGTYQLKRRRLKPNVRDPPEDGSADVGMADI